MTTHLLYDGSGRAAPGPCQPEAGRTTLCGVLAAGRIAAESNEPTCQNCRMYRAQNRLASAEADRRQEQLRAAGLTSEEATRIECAVLQSPDLRAMRQRIHEFYQAACHRSTLADHAQRAATRAENERQEHRRQVYADGYGDDAQSAWGLHRAASAYYEAVRNHRLHEAGLTWIVAPELPADNPFARTLIVGCYEFPPLT